MRRAGRWRGWRDAPRAILVIFAGLLIIWRELKLGLQRAQQRRAMGHVEGT